MNKLILCEGKTDAILLSYYLEKTCGWSRQNAIKYLSVNTDETHNESSYWYRRGVENLLICGVGGKDNFGTFFKEKIQDMMVASSAFTKIAVVTDRDKRRLTSIRNSFQSIFKPVITCVENNVWKSNTYINSYGQQDLVDFLLLVIPHENEGAMETLLLDAISEDAYDKVIVEKSKEFVDEVEPYASKYITKFRLKLKAYLGVSWAVQFPEKTFLLMNEQIRSISWESSRILEECFSVLRTI